MLVLNRIAFGVETDTLPAPHRERWDPENVNHATGAYYR